MDEDTTIPPRSLAHRSFCRLAAAAIVSIMVTLVAVGGAYTCRAVRPVSVAEEGNLQPLQSPTAAGTSRARGLQVVPARLPKTGGDTLANAQNNILDSRQYKHYREEGRGGEGRMGGNGGKGGKGWKGQKGEWIGRGRQEAACATIQRLTRPNRQEAWTGKTSV